jgi:hypothetical protein
MGLPDAVEQLVTPYLAGTDDAVPGLVEGLYLVGSVALDDFRAGLPVFEGVYATFAELKENPAESAGA